MVLVISKCHKVQTLYLFTSSNKIYDNISNGLFSRKTQENKKPKKKTYFGQDIGNYPLYVGNVCDKFLQILQRFV